MKITHNILSKIFLLLVLALGWGSSAWAQGFSDINWQDSNFESRGTYDLNQAVMFMTQEFTPTTGGNLVVNFKYDGGNKGLDVYGVDLVDNTGAVVTSAYNAQFTGGNRNTISYTLSGLTSGTTYTMRAFTAINADDKNDWINGSNTCQGIISYSGTAATGLSLKTTWNLANERASWKIYPNAPSEVLRLIRAKAYKPFNNVSSLDTQIANLEKGKTIAVLVQSTTGSITINGVELLDGSNVVASDIRNSSNSGIYVLTAPATGTFTLRILAQSISAGATGTVSNPSNIKFSNAPQNGDWAPNTAWHKIQNVRASQQNNSDGYMSTAADHKDSNGNLKLRVAGVPEDKDENALWCVVPSGSGSFYIYNKAAGVNQVMGTINNAGDGSSYSKMYEGTGNVANVTKTYNIGTNGNGFWICLSGTNKHLDDASNGFIGVWNNATEPKSKEGNRFIFTEVQITADVALTLAPVSGSVVYDLSSITLTADQAIMFSGEINKTDSSIPVVKPFLRSAGADDIEALSVEGDQTSFTITFPTSIPVGSYTLVIPDGTFYVNGAGGKVPVSGNTASYTIATPPATKGYRIIIKGDDGYAVSTTEAVTTGRKYAYDGEFLDLVGEVAANDTRSLSINAPEGKFVWGPIIDNAAKTITFEIRETASSFTAGRWYQLQMLDKAGQWFDGSVMDGNMVEGLNNITSIPLKNRGNYIYLMSSRASGYPLEFNGYETDAYHSFVYVEAVNGNNITLHSQNGSYVKSDGSGQASATTVPLTYNSGANAFSWGAKTGPWAYSATAGWITVGMTSRFSSASGNIQVIAHPVSFGEDYNIYKVASSEGAVTYAGSQACIVANGAALSTTNKTVNDGHYFFFPKGYTPVAADFTMSDAESVSLSISETIGTDGAKTLTVTPVYGTLGSAVRLEFKNGSDDSVMPNGSVWYTNPNTHERVQLTAANSPYDFGGVPFSTHLFTTEGVDILENVQFTTDGDVQTITFTIVHDLNMLQFSSAPSAGEWASDTKWFTIRNNRSNQNGHNRKFLTTSKVGVNDNCNILPTPEVLAGDRGDYWCFVGTEAGFSIQNAAYGPEFVLGISSSGDPAYAQMFRIGEVPSGYTTTFTAAENTYRDGASHAYGFRLGTSGNNHIHVTQGRFIIYNNAGALTGNDTGSAFMVTYTEESTVVAKPAYDIYKVSGVGIAYSGSRATFGRRENAPYLMVEKGADLTQEEVFGPYASLVSSYAVGQLAGSSYIKTITATKADASKDYYRVRLLGPVPPEFDHVRGDGIWHSTSVKKESYFELTTGAAFDAANLAAVTASNEVLTDGTVSNVSGDDGLFKATYKIVFPNVIVHRPNGLLWKAKRYGINKTQLSLVGPHTPDYVEVEQPGGQKIKLQNTNEFSVTHFLKPGAADATPIWYPTTASSGGTCKPMGYTRMFNYLNERDTQTIGANHNNGQIIAAQYISQSGTVKYANGYANPNIQSGYGNYFTAKLPGSFVKGEEYVLGFEVSRLTDSGAGGFGEGLLPDGNASYLRDLADDGTPQATFTDPNGNGGTDNLLEGTINLRQMYHIRSAYEIADKLSAATDAGKYLEEETIIFPTKNTEWSSFHNVIPLAYNCVDYWGYTSDKGDVKNLDYTNQRTDVQMIASIEGTNTAGITINALNNGYTGSTGVFTEKTDNNCRLSARYVTFCYPSGGVITTTGNEEKSATIVVKLVVDGKEYNVKRFNLRFVPNTDPIPHNEIIGHPEHSRSDAVIESRFGKPYEEISFMGEGNYVWKAPGDPIDDRGTNMPTADNGYTLYHQFPVDFGQMSYGNYTSGVPNSDKWVEWGEYGLQHGRNDRIPVNYLRAQQQKAEAAAQVAEIQSQLERPDLNDLEQTFYNDLLDQAQTKLKEATEEADAQYYRGYYIYADTSEQPGSIANLKINETLCPGTQFYVTAWMGNATEYDQSSSKNPNSIIFRVQGRDAVTGEFETIVAYCPGQISKSARAADRGRLQTVPVTLPNGTVISSLVPWQQVAFSFTNTAPSTKYSEFRIQIDNNSRGADGADLFLDDIRLYVKRPEVTVRDAAPVCGQELDLVRITTDFDAMMESIKGNTAIGGGGGGTQEYYGVYAILDKAKYEKLAKEENHAKAFEDALLGSVNLEDCKVDGTLIPSLYAFHTIKFYDSYERHALLTYNDLITSVQRTEAGRMELDGTRTLCFNCKIEDENLAGGKEYVLIFSVQIDPDAATYEYLDNKEPSFYVNYFNLLDNCRIIYDFKTSSANMVRLDGAEGVDPYHIDYCPGSAPNIKLTSYTYNLQTGKPEPEVGVAYDWYYGTLEQYKEEVVTAANCTVEHPSEEKVDHTLDQALMNLRYFYPNVDENSLSTVQPRAQEASHGVDYILTDCMIAQLNRLVDSGKLKLRKTNAIFELSKLEDEEEYHSVVAIKLSGRIIEDETGHHIYCAEPIEIKFYTKHETPGAAVGINGVDYAHNTPFNVRDKFGNLLSVPTRINSAQVSQLTSKNAKTYLRLPINVMEPSGYYKTDVDDGNGNMTPQNTNQVKFVIDPTNTDVVVVETNDPQWKVYEVSGSELYMPVVGKLKKIIARKSRSEFPWLASSTETDQLGIDFSDPTIQRKFEPREGYYYVLRACFLEEADEYDVAEDDSNFNPEYKTKFKFTKSKLFDTEGVMRCPGTILIPLKVVPQYMKWTGRESNDWNNDRNWIRADYSELVPSESQNPNDTFAWYRTNIKGNAGGSLTVGDENGLPVSSNDGKQEKDMDIYIPMDTPTSASPYANTFAYAPMEDTHVIIPADCEQYPALVTHSISTTTGTKGLLQLADGGEVNTPYITYDMVARLSSETDAGGIAHKIYSAEPYYENHVKDITFQMGGTMYDAQRLTYDKAWLEYALATNRWHTIGSPLQETVSGEWYSPTGTGDEAGRQLTPYFEEITYSPSLNNRFNPAYYQRSWDKATTNVYRMASDGMYMPTKNPINVAVSLDWSNVYNDVNVPYSAGGFSVKPVLADGADGEVLVRMPKADTSYLYYDHANSVSGHPTTITRGAGHYRLNSDLWKNSPSFELTVSNANPSENLYYLVSNPMMAPMNMEEFFNENTQFVPNTYWIMKDNLQSVSVKTDMGWISTDAAEGGVVAPLQAFFVKLKTAPAGSSIQVSYTPEMQEVVAPSARPALKARASRGAHSSAADTDVCDLPLLRITATNAQGALQSQALVCFSQEASAAYAPGEDAELLLDSNTAGEVASVFTMADGQALHLNAIGTNVKMIPLGVVAPTDDTETTLTLTGLSALEEVMAEAPSLYDAANGSFIPLQEGSTLTIQGTSAGRYYLVSGMQLPVEDTISDSNRDYYNLQGIRVASPQHGTVTISRHQKQLMR